MKSDDACDTELEAEIELAWQAFKSVTHLDSEMLNESFKEIWTMGFLYRRLKDLKEMQEDETRMIALIAQVRYLMNELKNQGLDQGLDSPR